MSNRSTRGQAATGFLLVIVIVAGFSIAGLFMLDTTIQNSKHDISVTNESFTPSAGTIQSLEKSNLDRADYNDTVDVYDENDTLLDESGNYTWFESNGTIKPTTGGELDGDANASISYGWNGQTERQEGLTDVIVESQVFVILLPIAGLLVLVGVLWAAMGRV